ncbi:MAG: TIGR03032 family protein [Leptolyngbyaceae cyanobacterium]
MSTPNPSEPAPLQYIHSTSFVDLLATLGISLFVSTYQAGRLMVVQAEGDRLSTLLRNFVQIMGVALTPHRLALGTRNQIHFFRNIPSAIRYLNLEQLENNPENDTKNSPKNSPENNPENNADACYIPRHSIVTGDIRVHELAWVSDQLWVVNTQFSCLCTLHPDYSFVPQWRPPFISQIATGDRCHLNGFAIVNGQPKYATVFARTDSPQGWRSHKVDGGCILDIPTGEVICHGLSMPHSPRFYDGKLWVLDSGRGRLVTVDVETGTCTTVAEFPGFTRGLAFYGRYGLIGLSQIREKETFGGLPLETRNDDLKCGVWAIDIITGETVAFLEFQEGCSELFDLQVLATAQHPMVLGFQRQDINHLFIWQ